MRRPAAQQEHSPLAAAAATTAYATAAKAAAAAAGISAASDATPAAAVRVWAAQIKDPPIGSSAAQLTSAAERQAAPASARFSAAAAGGGTADALAELQSALQQRSWRPGSATAASGTAAPGGATAGAAADSAGRTRQRRGRSVLSGFDLSNSGILAFTDGAFAATDLGSGVYIETHDWRFAVNTTALGGRGGRPALDTSRWGWALGSPGPDDVSLFGGSAAPTTGCGASPPLTARQPHRLRRARNRRK